MENTLKQEAKELLSKKKFVLVNSNGLYLSKTKRDDIIFEVEKSNATKFDSHYEAMKMAMKIRGLKIEKVNYPPTP